MKKPIYFDAYQILHRASYKEAMQWIKAFYAQAYQDGIDVATKTSSDSIPALMPEDCTVAIEDSDLRELILSVKGVSPRIADEIMEKLGAFGVDHSLWNKE